MPAQAPRWHEQERSGTYSGMRMMRTTLLPLQGATAPSARRAGWLACLLFVLAGLLGTATDLRAHLALVGSTPAADEVVSDVPQDIVLTFSETIDLPLSRITLVGPGGEIELGPISADDAGTEMSAAIPDGLAPGSYQVEWQAVGRDGHPVRGSFGFEVDAPVVEALAIEEPIAPAIPPIVEIPTGTMRETVAQPDSEFSAQSPLYAAVRWMNYLGIIGSGGSIVFLMLLRGSVQRTEPGLRAIFIDPASRGTTAFGLMMAGILAISIALRLQAQSHTVLGAGLSPSNIGVLLGSSWGTALSIQAAAAVALGIGLALARRSAKAGLSMAAVAMTALALSAALSSHAASAPRLRGFAIFADSLHILVAAAWLGTLLVFVVVGVPHLQRIDGAERSLAYQKLLRTFSAVAMVSGGILVMTGVFAASQQLTGPADLTGTRYGRVLAAKLILAAGVFALGALNWRRLPRQQHESDAVTGFRARATVELCVALLVVVVTAVLVAIPPPAHEEAIATMTAEPLPPE